MKKVVFSTPRVGPVGAQYVLTTAGIFLEYCKKRVLFPDFDPQITLTKSFLKNSLIPENKCLEKLIVNFIKKDEINKPGPH